MPVIVVGNEKGGCGKTTVSVNLAAAGAQAGLTVLLVDADPGQQSAARWAAVRRDRHPEAPSVRCVSLTSEHVMDELRDFRSQYGLVVVDTGAEDSPQLRGAAVVADAMVIPVQPDELDLWTLPTMATVFTQARRHNPELRAVIVLNRVPYQTADKLPAEVKAWIRTSVPGFEDVPLIALIGRAAYGRATGDGHGVGEPAQFDNKAVAEMAKLYQEILKHGRTNNQVQGRRTADKGRH